MAKLILHVGPGKCGSSSIQQFFANQKNPCVQSTNYNLLNPREISELNHEFPNKSILATFTEQLLENLNRYDALILSHEYLFSCPYAIKNICCLAKNLVTKISIIGYSRRQSDFLVSAYSQWLFRSPDRINETTKILDELEIDSVLFTGLERQIIAFIANDFYSARLSECRILDWHNSYNNILQLVHKSDAVIKCGVLPNKESDISLIQDFCEKSELTLHEKVKSATLKVSNLSFNQDVVEAINNAIILGLDMPGPHESNAVIDLLSSKLSPMKKNSSEFLTNLKSYIDTYYLVSNKKLCKQYGLNETYFVPSKKFSKPEIIDMIVHEGYQRSLNKSTIIRNYRMLSAKMIELCIKLAKDD